MLVWLPACITVPGKTRAEELAANGEYEKADEAYSGAMRGRITDQEWTWASRARCKMRLEWLDQELEGVQSGDLSLTELDRFFAIARRCPEATDELAKIQHLTISGAEDELDALLRTEDNRWAKLLAAETYMHRFPDDHEKWAWFGGLVEEVAADHLDAASAAQTEVEAHYQQALAARVRDENQSGALEEAAFAQISVQLGDSDIAMDDSCRRLLGGPARPNGPNGRIEFDVRARFTGCSETTESRSRVVTYYEEKFRTELVEEWRYKKVPVYKADYVSDCVPGHCTYRAVASNEIAHYDLQKEKVLVERQVPYYVKRQKTVVDSLPVLKSRLTVEVTSPNGQETRSVAIRRVDDARNSLLNAPQDEMLPVARQVAIDMLVDDLRREWRELEPRTDQSPRARELAIVLWVTRQHDTERVRRVMRTIGELPEGALADGALPRVNHHAPMQQRVPIIGFSEEPSRSKWGLLENGFPLYTTSLGVNYRVGDELPEQPQRTSVNGELDVKMEGSLTTGEASRGIGLHSLADVRLHVGQRTSDPWVYPEPFEFAEDEPQQEWKLSAGFQLTGGLFAGGRMRHVALFAGPEFIWHGAFMGDYTTAGVELPLAVMVELRVIERYPIRARIWGMDLRGGDTSSHGGRLEMHLGRDAWFYAEYEEKNVRTQVSGLREGDEIFAGVRPLRTGSVGFMTSVFGRWF
jgi:hypothetical protein